MNIKSVLLLPLDFNNKLSFFYSMSDERQPLKGPDHPQTARTRLDGVRDPTDFYCAKCAHNKVSEVRHQAGSWTYICCGIWCLLTFVGGLIPFCINGCKDAVSSCPDCHTEVGKAEFRPF